MAFAVIPFHQLSIKNKKGLKGHVERGVLQNYLATTINSNMSSSCFYSGRTHFFQLCVTSQIRVCSRCNRLEDRENARQVDLPSLIGGKHCLHVHAAAGGRRRTALASRCCCCCRLLLFSCHTRKEKPVHPAELETHFPLSRRCCKQTISRSSTSSLNTHSLQQSNRSSGR